MQAATLGSTRADGLRDLAHLCQFEFLLRQLNWRSHLSVLAHKLPISFHLHLMEAARQWKDSTGASPQSKTELPFHLQ